MHIRLRKNNAINNFNDIQIEINNIIANQSSPFTYDDILKTVKQTIKTKGATQEMMQSARLSEMIYKALRFHVAKQKLSLQSGQYYITQGYSDFSNRNKNNQSIQIVEIEKSINSRNVIRPRFGKIIK